MTFRDMEHCVVCALRGVFVPDGTCRHAERACDRVRAHNGRVTKADGCDGMALDVPSVTPLCGPCRVKAEAAHARSWAEFMEKAERSACVQYGANQT